MPYLHWNEKTITDFSEKNITDMYAQGYVFTRIGRGVMHQTRSVRINLSRFELTSENRRILKKVAGIVPGHVALPYSTYDYTIGKLAKDFYTTKFGHGVMSATKIKHLMTDPDASNFNTLITYRAPEPLDTSSSAPIPAPILGYTISYANSEILHYSYPFYDLDKSPKDMGLGMMTLALHHAKEMGITHVYLGSLQRSSDTYKLQFNGLEWFDGSHWSTDEARVRDILATSTQDASTQPE